MQECRVFEEVLTLRCHRSRLRVKLRGEGISPAIKVSLSTHCSLLIGHCSLVAYEQLFVYIAHCALLIVHC